MRESGFYWVKIEGSIHVGRYCSALNVWEVSGYPESTLTDSDVEVLEGPLKPPGSV